MTTAIRTGTQATRVGRARWVVGALLAGPWVFLACSGHVRLNTQEGGPSLDGGGDGSPAGPSDSAVSDGTEAAGDAGCSDRLDAAQATITNLLSQYGSCKDAGDCTALPVLGYCMVVSIAQSADFLAAAAQASQGAEAAGCLAPSIACDSVQVKCAGKCTAAGKLSMP